MFLQRDYHQRVEVFMRQSGGETELQKAWRSLRSKANSETKLRSALRGLQATENQTNQALAQKAGVSTRTLRAVMDGTLTNEDEKGTPKNVRGYAESLTRLSVYCELDPKVVLKEYGLDPGLPAVKLGMERVLSRRVPQRIVSDPVLDRIFERGGKICAGILKWEPFVQVSGAVEESWAWKEYLRALLGTVNPLRDHKPFLLETIASAIDAVQSPRKECDLGFGIYETAYRRTLGLAFVPIPGIGAPLGVLYEGVRGNGGTSRKMTWSRLLDAPGDFKAFALREEVGHLFLKGVCNFPENPQPTGPGLQLVEEGQAGELAFTFLKGLVEGRDVDFSQRILVADRPTCNLVRSLLRVEIGTILADRKIPEHQHVQYREAAAAVTLLDAAEDDDMAPVYPVSIVVRADAHRWEQLLRTATQELFRNSPGLVARAYVNLLKSGAASLRPLPLDPHIPRYQAAAFTKRVFKDLPGVSDPWPVHIKDVWLKRARDVWETETEETPHETSGEETTLR